MGNRKKTDLEVLIDALPILQKCGVSSVQVGEIAFKFHLGLESSVLDFPYEDATVPEESDPIPFHVQHPESLTAIKDTDTIISKSDTDNGDGIPEDGDDLDFYAT